MNPDFRDFFELLIRHGVSFAVIGGVAYNHYAPPRATKDIDIWVEPSPENVARLTAAIAAFGFPIDAIDQAALIDPRASVLMLGRVPNRIDVLTHPKGLEWAVAAPRLMTASYGGVAVPMIGLGDLITLKRAAARPRDLADAAELERVARAPSRRDS
jgi:hypothetical protein